MYIYIYVYVHSGRHVSDTLVKTVRRSRYVFGYSPTLLRKNSITESHVDQTNRRPVSDRQKPKPKRPKPAMSATETRLARKLRVWKLSAPLLAHAPPRHTRPRIPVMSRDPRMPTHGGSSMLSTCLLEVSKSDFPSRDNMSAGLSSKGTHSIHMRHPRRRPKMYQAAAINWMSQDLLQPFVRAQHTDWLSMKKSKSRPLNMSL